MIRRVLARFAVVLVATSTAAALVPAWHAALARPAALLAESVG